MITPSSIEPVISEMPPAVNEFVPTTNEFLPVQNPVDTSAQNHGGGFNVPSEAPKEIIPTKVIEEPVEQIAPKKEAISDYFRKK